MAKAAKKKPAVPMIVFSRARDIPFNRIRLSDSNVREIDVEAGLDELTHDIDRREDLVQGLNVRAILDEDGNESGDFETPAGGRRYRSIARLVEAGRFRPRPETHSAHRRGNKAGAAGHLRRVSGTCRRQNTTASIREPWSDRLLVNQPARGRLTRACRPRGFGKSPNARG